MRRLTWWTVVAMLLAACGAGKSSLSNEAAVATAVQLTVAARPVMTETSLPEATKTNEPATPAQTSTSTAIPVADPFTDEWRVRNLAFAESIATKMALIETTAVAVDAGDLTFEEAKTHFTEALPYIVDAMNYRDFILKSAESNLHLSDDELKASAALRKITEEASPCMQAVIVLADVMQSQDTRVRRQFIDTWHTNCSSVALESLRMLR